MRSIVVIIFAYLIFTASSGSGTVVINEVELNPPGDDRDNEWVELYNSGDNHVDVSRWVLQSTCGGRVKSIVIPSKCVIIPPKNFCVVVGCSQWLDNEEELVILQNATGVEIDRTPYLDDNRNNDCAWSRYPDGYDSDSSFEWGFMKSSKGEPASGSVCYPDGTHIYFHLSGSVEGDISPIVVSTTGTKITPHSSCFTEYAKTYKNGSFAYNSISNGIRTRTSALEGHYTSEEIMYNGKRCEINVEPQVGKPEINTTNFGLYSSKTIDYTGQGICDREYIGCSQSCSESNFLYNTNLSKERIGTSLKAHSKGMVDLKYRQIRPDGNISEEYIDRYVGEFNIERHIETKFVNDTHTSYYGYGLGEYPKAVYINGILVYPDVVEELIIVYNNETVEYNENWLTCCFDNDILVGSKKVSVYHYSWCPYVKNIKPENLIIFSSPKDAKSHGYRPCEICKPPSKDVWSGLYAPCIHSASATL